MMDRREFIKLTSLLPLRPRPLYFSRPDNPKPAGSSPNILVIVFDSLSARNCSLFGYPRQTTPLLEKLAERAIVYHNHYAGGTFTTPGTASLLTGLLPWTHRAVEFFNPILEKDFAHGIFHQLRDEYYLLAYTHNSLADVFLREYIADMQQYIPRQNLFLRDYWVSDIFLHDFDVAFVSAHYAIEDKNSWLKSSVYLSELNSKVFEPLQEKAAEKYRPLFPRDVPNISGKYFLLEDGIDWLLANLPQMPGPYLGYFHFYPPHYPYTTRKEFINLHLRDGYQPVEKEKHLFGLPRNMQRAERERRIYDEFINYVDFEFDRLMQRLEDEGALEDTWVVLTSDHGEMFERGIIGHDGETMHQPLVNIPLVILPPGQAERVDITSNTSAVDVVPTLMQLAGKQPPVKGEGQLLPPFNQDEVDRERPIFCVKANKDEALSAFTSHTLMMVKGNLKLVYYANYGPLPEGSPLVELFDLENDPEELNDLSRSETATTEMMLDELLQTFNQHEAQYLGKQQDQ